MQREERQIALTSIAEETKIKLALLEGLEKDDVSHWPSGIFRKAYVRTYAHMIGLDPDEALREFLELYPDPADVREATAVALAATGDPSRRPGPPTRLRNMVDSAIGSLARLRRAAGSDDGQQHRARPGSPLDGRPAEPASSVAAAAPVAIDVRDEDFEVDPGTESPRVERLVQAMGTTPVSVPALLKPADGVAPLIAVAAPAEQPAAEAAVQIAIPVPQPETVVIGPVDPPAIEPLVPPPAARMPDPPAPTHDLDAMAGLCSALARVVDRDRVQQLLQEAARELSAIGIIIWTWDGIAEELRPALVHGYSARVLAQLPPVKRDDDNFTAAAFRSAQTSEVKAADHGSGALVVPLLTPEGCVGVLAIELQPGVTNTRTIRAIATILAAVLAPLAVRSHAADQRAPVEPPVPALDMVRMPARPIRVRR
jgi:hypothetical protein